MSLILASRSPRRAALLKQAGIAFKVVVPAVSEELDSSLTPEELVLGLALKKAESVAAAKPASLVLGADTLVLHRNKILGKPAGEEEARRMLKLLSGDCHTVITGIALLGSASGILERSLSRTRVWMKKISQHEINAYVATGEPLDKAGAYGIQGKAGLYVEKIEGCYFNVVGLPLGALYDLLTKHNFKI